MSTAIVDGSGGTEPRVDLLSGGNRTHPSPFAPAMIVVVEGTEQRTLTVQPGQRMTVGRDPSAVIVLSDPQVSFQHAVIERRGPGWLVSSLDPANPVWLLDSTGRAQPIEGALGLRSGELLIGGCQLMLYSPPPGPQG